MQTPAPGHVKGAKAGSDPAAASAGNGVGLLPYDPKFLTEAPAAVLPMAQRYFLF